ncbi:MAG: BMC domain-containing protein [Eubacteriales bacterium]|nr:BMC domain-containing protein [Eubacteriales bacterium]
MKDIDNNVIEHNPQDDRITAQELQSILADMVRKSKTGKARVTRVSIPGRAIILAHIIGVSEPEIYKNLALDIGFHAGDDPTGRAIGILRMNPWETVVIGADIATKAADVDIGFMDRFSGALILTGEHSQIVTAVKEVVRYFSEELNYPCAPVTEN